MPAPALLARGNEAARARATCADRFSVSKGEPGMPIKQFKPTSPGRRGMSGYTFEEITRTTAGKSLLRPLTKTAGRNNQGRVTQRRRGGGHKRRYRVVDFLRNKDGVPGIVHAVEYDPNRSARLALIHYADGEKRYILAPEQLRVGESVLSGESASVRVGNALPLSQIPLGTTIHNVELTPGRGGQLGRSAGSSVQLMAREGKYAHLRLPSGEVRLVHVTCRCTIGQVGNLEHESITLGKAGRNRHRGRRPKVRGKAMNPDCHPHGGGEGGTSVGRRKSGPVSPTGVPAIGYRTRRRKPSDKLIVRRRYGK